MITQPLRIGFLGAGQMSTALARSWNETGLLDLTHCKASDPIAEARDKFEDASGIPTTANNLEIVQSCEILILAVKPQSMKGMLSEIRTGLTSNHLIISIAAGITLRQMAEWLEANYRLVRVMPNTPCLVRSSASGFAVSSTCTPDDVILVERLFNAVGKAFSVPEKLLDAVTGLSGSGPAYVYVMIEAMADGGVRMGLPRDIALTLAAQTVYGAARMILETKQHPGVLKDAVTSPGGTTIAGLHELENGAFRGTIMNAVEAATNRSMELGK